MMNIYLSFPNSELLLLEVNPSDLISSVIERATTEMGLKQNLIKLEHVGNVLNGNCPIFTTGIEPDDTVIVSLSPLGNALREIKKENPSIIDFKTAIVDDDELVMLYLDAGFSINCDLGNGETPLYVAAENNNHQLCAKMLSEPGIEPLSSNSDWETPLYVACSKGHISTVEFLISNETFKDRVNDQNKSGTTPLIASCEKGHEAVVRLLLTISNIDVNIQTNRGDSALTVTLGNYPHLASLLLSIDTIDVNLIDDSGFTPLVVASRIGDVECVKLLVNHPKISFSKQPSPLCFAAWEGKLEVVNFLLTVPQVALTSEIHKASLLAEKWNQPRVVLALKQHSKGWGLRSVFRKLFY